MKIENGRLLFEEGDRLNIDNDHLIARKGHECAGCYMDCVCSDYKEIQRTLKRFCKNIHFENAE